MKPLLALIYLLFLLACLLISTNSIADKPYLDKNRIAYIEKVFTAFSETPISDINNMFSYINIVDRNNCRSSLSDLKVACLLNFAKKNCIENRNKKLRENCQLYTDIIVVNKISENSFVSRTERYRMLKKSNTDFRTTITNKLQQKYARIVTDFSLTQWSDCDTTDFTCLAKGLDKFCLDYTNSKNLSWQYCVSASLWFIGSSRID